MAIHKNLPDSELHEPKGAGSATQNQFLLATGSGTTTWEDIPIWMGFWDYNDAATAVTPITLAVAGTFYNLTNDELGAFTNKTYRLPSVLDIWDTSTQRFDWTGLELGDTVDIRVDVQVTTTGANHEIALHWEFAIGSGAAYELEIVRRNFKAAGTYTFTVLHSAYMGDNNTLNFPSVLKMSSDTGSTDTVVVNGWYVRVIKRNPDFG